MLKFVVLCLSVIPFLYAAVPVEVSFPQAQRELKDAFSECLEFPINDPASVPSISKVVLDIPKWFLFQKLSPMKLNDIINVLHYKSKPGAKQLGEIAKSRLPKILAKKKYEPLLSLLKNNAEMYKTMENTFSYVSPIKVELDVKTEHLAKIQTYHKNIEDKRAAFFAQFPKFKKSALRNMKANEERKLLDDFLMYADAFFEAEKLNSLDPFSKDDPGQKKFKYTSNLRHVFVQTANALKPVIEKHQYIIQSWNNMIEPFNIWYASLGQLHELLSEFYFSDASDPELKNTPEIVKHLERKLSHRVAELKPQFDSADRHEDVKFFGKPAFAIIEKFGSFEKYVIFLIQTATNELFALREMIKNFELSGSVPLSTGRLIMITIISFSLIGGVIFIFLMLKKRSKKKADRQDRFPIEIGTGPSVPYHHTYQHPYQHPYRYYNNNRTTHTPTVLSAI